MKFTHEEYTKLVEQVEQELTSLLAKSESEVSQPLNKSEESAKEEDKKDEPQEDKKEEESVEAKAEDKQEEEKKDEPKDEESCDYDDEDHEEMHKMYGSMSKGELNAHKQSVEKCWMAKCGDMQQMAKSEKTESVVTETESTKLVKSENETLKKEVEGLKTNLAEVLKAMTSYVTKKAPERKAITDVSFIAKSEDAKPVEKTLSKSEVTAILNRKTKDATLSKSDRELINNYYINNAAVSTVSHLLK